MSDTILSNRWKVYYLSETRQKRIERDVSVTPTVTDDIKDLYTALADLFDEFTQMDDGTVMKYATPTEYTIGKIDTGDTDPWFVDMRSVEYIYGGALETSGWRRITTSNTGVVRVTRAGTNIVSGDIGLVISHADGDMGTLLDVNGSHLWIRPSSSASGDNWDSTSGNITCNSHVDTQSVAAETGELLWSNIYSIGSSLDGDSLTRLYVYQEGTKLTAYKGAQSWWSEGHIDILVQVKTPGAGNSVLIDDGYIIVFPRRYSQQYDNYIVDLSSGGRNPIPLSVGADINNETGYRQVTLGTSSGTWSVGDEIEGKVTASRGVITNISGTNPTIMLQYYLIDVLTDFNGSEGIENNTGTGDSSSSGATSSDGPSSLVGLSIVHAANSSYDIDEDGTNEYYSIVIDCSDELLADVYEWTKYVLRRGSTDTSNNDGQNGEAYIGTTYYINYTTLSGSIAEGSIVTQLVSGAKGVVVAHHTGSKILVLRSTRGTFNNTNNIEEGANYVTGPTCYSMSANKASPYGTFAGGRWFCAPGVVLANVPSVDYNNWQTTDDQRVAKARPIKVDVSVGNTRVGDRIAVWRLDVAGGIIQKDVYAIDSLQSSLGEYSVRVDPAILVDEPGKTSGGKLRVVDESEGWEHRYRYTGWSGDLFNLYTLSGVADAGGSSTSLLDSAGDFITNGVQIGDIIFNSTESTYAYVTVTGTSSLTTTNIGSNAPVIDWTTDSYVVGVLVEDYTTSDTVYVPFIDELETVGTDGAPGLESVQIVYDAVVPARCRVRSAGDIIPFVADFTIGSSGGTINVIRNLDTVHGT